MLPTQVGHRSENLVAVGTSKNPLKSPNIQNLNNNRSSIRDYSLWKQMNELDGKGTEKWQHSYIHWKCVQCPSILLTKVHRFLLGREDGREDPEARNLFEIRMQSLPVFGSRLSDCKTSNDKFWLSVHPWNMGFPNLDFPVYWWKEGWKCCPVAECSPEHLACRPAASQMLHFAEFNSTEVL